jgi:quercetin dioxygenase-like cupin family protein
MPAHQVIDHAATVANRNDTNWGSLSWFASRELADTAGITAGRVVIKVGECNPRHAHPNCEEVLHLLAGELDHTVGGETVRLRAGDTLVVKPNVYHNARSVGTCDADMIVIFSSGDREFVEEGKR